MTIAIVPSTDEIVLLQMDGNMTREELDHGLDMAFKAAHEVYDVQRAALKKRYSDISKKEGDSVE